MVFSRCGVRDPPPPPSPVQVQRRFLGEPVPAEPPRPAGDAQAAAAFVERQRAATSARQRILHSSRIEELPVEVACA